MSQPVPVLVLRKNKVTMSAIIQVAVLLLASVLLLSVLDFAVALSLPCGGYQSFRFANRQAQPPCLCSRQLNDSYFGSARARRCGAIEGYRKKCEVCSTGGHLFSRIDQLHRWHASTELSSRAGLTCLGGQNDSASGNESSKNSPVQHRSKARWALFGTLSLALAVWKRELIFAVLAHIRSLDIKAWLVKKLDYLNQLGTPGLIAYSVFFFLWEIFVGITTPIEVSAGMAFGLKNAVIFSTIGKIGGALVSFLMGKFLLQDYVHRKLGDNEMLGLVEDSIEANPIRVSLVWRFSPLPEFVKNFGLSILPLKTRNFLAAVVLHGFPFTCLWSCLGAETGMLMRGTVTKPSRTLKIIVSGIPWFGFFVSPTLVGLWVKSLKNKRKEGETL